MDSARALTRVTELLIKEPRVIEQSRGRRFEARYITITDTINAWGWDAHRPMGMRNAGRGDRCVYVCGPNVKKDGSFGKMLGGESWFIQSWSVLVARDIMPNWLADIVSQVRHPVDTGE
jgi:hypothetical protein